jgi:hypothetical protein
MKSSKRNLSDWINGFIEYTANSEAPYSYRKWTAISCVASALQRKCRIEWGTGITWYPNMYIVLVGPSAARKGTAMSPGLEILEAIGTIKIAANSTSLQALIKRLKDTNHNDPDLETGEMIFHASMTVFSKEFTVFLGYQNNAMIAALCDWYDCDRRWKYETISRQTEEIVGVWVNLIGATTPDLIRLCMPIEMIGGGLTSRIIYVVEDKKAKSEPCPQTTEEETLLKQQLITDLEKITLMSGKFKYSANFINTWSNWYIENDLNPPDIGKHFQGYLGRRATHVMKLAMIFSASRDNVMEVTVADFNRAVATIHEVELNMSGVFKGVGKNPYADTMHQALTWLCSLDRNEVSLIEFYNRYQDDLDRVSLERMIQSLEIAGKVKRLHKPGADELLLILPT